MRLLGSIAIHALLAVLLVQAHHAREATGPAPQLELVDVAITAAASPSDRSPEAGTAKASPMGRSPGAGTAKASPVRRENAFAVPASGPRAASPRTPPSGELRIEPVGDGNGAGSDGGAGSGGSGTGLGLGNGQGLGELLPAAPLVPAPPPAPPAEKVSKARPARLIYPSRQTQVDADRLFVADVIVDPDGYVVGAKLATRSGPRDGEAGALVWRFRYDPALDDDGRPVRSTVHQPFAVAW